MEPLSKINIALMINTDNINNNTFNSTSKKKIEFNRYMYIFLFLQIHKNI